MLSTKEITKLYKGTKITLRVDLYKTTKSGSKSSTGVQGSSVTKFRKLKKFAGCKILHLAGLRNFATCCEIFATCEILQVANFRNPAKFRRLRIFATLPNFHYVFLLFCIFAPNLFWFYHASLNSARVHRV